MLVLLLLTGVSLVVAGARLVAESTTGRLVDPVDDPAEPGFEALVEPTPTLALVTVDARRLVGIAVLTLPDPNGSGGGVVVVPQRTVGDLAVLGRAPLEASYAFGNDGTLVDAVGVLLGVGISERAEVDDARWADLVAPVAPITLDNPNALYVDGTLRFDVGEIELEGPDVGPFLRAGVDGESDLERLFRHEVFFAAWLDAVAAHGGADAVPGELDSGIGRFVRSLAAGDVDIATLPVRPAESDDHGPALAYVADADAATALIEQLVPLPTAAAPGERARVRVLNGTADTDRASAVAPMLPPAGVEVVSVGNASSFDATRTTVRYGPPEFAYEARAVADLLGADDVSRDDRSSDSFDITVTLGPDAPDAA